MTLSCEIQKALGIKSDLLFESLTHKESSTNSSIGDGIALPNLQIKGLAHPFTILATLKTEINFGSVDDIPVDIVALVLSPERDGPAHLRRIARISRLLKNGGLHKKLVEARDEDIMRSLLVDPEGWLMAA